MDNGSSWPMRHTSCGRRFLSCAQPPRSRSRDRPGPRTTIANRSPSSRSSPRGSRASLTPCSCSRAPRRTASRSMREPLYLDDLVAECARALRVLADERGVTVRRRETPRSCSSGDNTLLQQMVGNLLDNAIRHATIWSERSTATVGHDSNALTIRVADDGEGIPVDEQERIFERFVALRLAVAGGGPRPAHRALDCRSARGNAHAGGDKGPRELLYRVSSGRVGCHQSFIYTLQLFI